MLSRITARFLPVFSSPRKSACECRRECDWYAHRCHDLFSCGNTSARPPAPFSLPFRSTHKQFSVCFPIRQNQSTVIVNRFQYGLFHFFMCELLIQNLMYVLASDSDDVNIVTLH